MRKVMHGDRVLASVTGMDRRGRREGTIVEVLERRLTRLIGRYTEEAGIGYVVPDDKRVQRNVMIPANGRNDARNGQLVVAEITMRRMRIARRSATCWRCWATSSLRALAVEAAIHGHDIPHEFPPEVLAKPTAVPLQVTEAADIAGRVDLRNVPLVTIDGEDAKDFDDAVWCEPNKQRLPPDRRVSPMSRTTCARARRWTTKRRSARPRCISPASWCRCCRRRLSNGICSLNPKVDRLCFVCDMQVGRDGDRHRSRFYEAVMHSHARLTYTQVWKAVGENDATRAAKIGGLLPQIQRLHQLYQLLGKARKKRGAIEFESTEVRFVLGPAGRGQCRPACSSATTRTS
jgi:ribonuclease R